MVEYGVEVDEDAKLVNVLNPSRALIVQLSYSSIDEVFEDDFQALIRDAVRTQCSEEGQAETWHAVSSESKNGRAKRSGGDGRFEAGWGHMASVEEVCAEQRAGCAPRVGSIASGPSTSTTVGTSSWNDPSGDFWDAVPTDAGHSGFFAEFWDENIEIWLQDRGNVALVRAEVDTISGIGKLLRQASTNRLQEVQELYIGGQLSTLYRKMCEELSMENTLTRFEMRLKEIIDRLYYEHEEVRQLEKEGCREDVIFVEERAAIVAEEEDVWDSTRDLASHALDRQVLEEDFELALRLQEEEDQGTGRGSGRQTGRNLGQNVATRIPLGNPGSGAALLAALQSGPGTANSGPLDRGAELLSVLQSRSPSKKSNASSGEMLLAALNARSPRAASRGGKQQASIDANDDFPSLPPGSRPTSSPVKNTRKSQRNVSSAAGDRLSTKTDARKLHTSAKDDFAGLTKLSGMRGLLVDHLKYEERQEVLDHSNRVLEGSASRGVSVDRMKAMMAKSAKDTTKLSHCERLLRDGPSRDTFSRKSMEKLKSDMLAVGWVNIRHASHLVYRREMPVPPICGSHAPLVQKTVVSCTPSSPHAISKVFHAVYKAEVELYERLLEMKHAEDDRRQ